jgi:hypothetical protein
MESLGLGTVLAKVLIRALVPDIGDTLASQLEDAEGATGMRRRPNPII